MATLRYLAGNLTSPVCANVISLSFSHHAVQDFTALETFAGQHRRMC